MSKSIFKCSNISKTFTQGKNKVEVLKNIYYEMENKTVISISHDVNSLKYCGKIYLLKDCELKNYDQK